MKIGVIASSAPVGKVELEMGLDRLRAEGWEVKLHSQVTKKHLFFAGTDDQRAQALVDFAYDPSIDVIWCARGGYGAFRTLSRVRELTKDKPKPPKKLLVGYSDVTATLSFVNQQWGWKTLHSPMCGTGEFSNIPASTWREIKTLVAQNAPPAITHKLKWWNRAPSSTINADVVGGNLTVWLSLMGTPLQPASTAGKILFLEDVDEAPYRLDRIFNQLDAMGGLNGVKALVLGTFSDCEDSVMNVLVKRPSGKKTAKAPAKQPLRPRIPQARALKEIFCTVADRHGISVGGGMKVGHGGGFRPLPLSAFYELTPQGVLTLRNWS